MFLPNFLSSLIAVSFHDFLVRTAERQFLTRNEDAPITTEKRDGFVSSSIFRIDSQTPHRRITKQISHRVQSTAERSAAVPVGQATTTLLVRHPLAVRRQLVAPRSPPRLRGVQPRTDDSRTHQRPVAIRRTQIRRLPLSQAAHVRKSPLFVIGNLSRPTSHKDTLDRSSRPRTVPLPPVEPPRHWIRHRVRAQQLQRPTNKQLTDVRALLRTSSMSNGGRGEEPVPADLMSDSDVEKAVLKAIIESSTTSSRRNGRIRRPFHRTGFPHSSDVIGATRRPVSTRRQETPPTSTVRVTNRRPTSVTKASRIPAKPSAKPTSRPVFSVNPETPVNVAPAVVTTTPAAITPPPVQTTTSSSPLLLFSTSRRRVTSLLNRTQNQHDLNPTRPLHRQGSTTTQPHRPVTTTTLPTTTTTTTQPPVTAAPSPRDDPSAVTRIKVSGITPSQPRGPSQNPPTVTAATPAVGSTSSRVPVSLKINDSAEVPNASIENLEPESQKPTEVMSDTAVRKNLVDHSTSNEDAFDVDPAILNKRPAIVAPLKNLPISETMEGSADIPEEETTTIPTTSPTTSSSTTTTSNPPATPSPSPSFASNENNSTQEKTTHSTPFPLTSLQDATITNGVLKEELNQNLVEEGTTPALTPPPSSPSSGPATSPQEAGAPGAAPPNDSVVEELNRAENFMEVARRLRILRSEIPQKRQRRWTKIRG